VNVIIVRPFNHAGPRQNSSFVVSDFAKQFAEIALKRREPTIRVGNLDVGRDFTDVRDVVRAYWLLFERRSHEYVFNVGSNQPMGIREIVLQFKRISGIEARIEQETQRVRSYDVPTIVASYQRLNNATGWSPQIPFEQTLRDTYSYWLNTLKSAS
jgi:GDP-4-dehydro-6-deoxy-D-mannose reductase